MTISTIEDPAGKIVGASQRARDVTAEMRVERALAASERRYRRLFETAQDGILILDAESGVVLDVNPFLTELLGFSYEQFMGRVIWELGFLADVAADEASFAKLKAKDYIRYESLQLETFDRKRIAVDFVSNVYRVEGARVIQCNVRDVSKRHAAEAALRARSVFVPTSSRRPMPSWCMNTVAASSK